MSHMMPYSFLPEFGFAVPLDDLRPSPPYEAERPARRDRPLGEILGLHGLTKLATDSHGGEVKILDDVTLSVRRGEILGLVGPDADGATALLRSLNLLERPTAGEIIHDGEVVQDREGESLAALRRKIGVVFRDDNLLSSRRAFDNVALPMRLARRRAWEIANRVPVLLDLVGLGDKQNAFPHQLSADEKRRLGIARALALQPEILLCEAPTAFLAPDAAHRVLALLQEVNRQTGVTIVLTTDDMSVIRSICDRLAVLEAGRIVEEGPVWESFAHPRTLLTRRLLQGLLPELPPFIRARIRPAPEGPSDTILRLKFGGSSAYDPIIANFAREADAVFSVIHGAIDYIQERPLGVLFLSLQATGPGHLRSLISYLRSRVLDVEVIGYVPDLLDLFARALWQAFVAFVAAGAASLVAGLPLAILLTRTDREGFSSRPKLQRFRGGAGATSLLILLLALVPVIQLILGRSGGSLAAVIPLSLAASAYFACLAEGALNRVDPGLIDAGLAMGASRSQILLQFLLPEALPQIGTGFLVTLAGAAGASLIIQALGAGAFVLGDGQGLSHLAVNAIAAAAAIVLIYHLPGAGSRRLGRGF